MADKVRETRKLSASVADEAKRLLEANPKMLHGPRCAVGRSEHMELITAMIDQGGEGTQVERIIRTTYGEHLPDGSVRRHFREMCGCHRNK